MRKVITTKIIALDVPYIITGLSHIDAWMGIWEVHVADAIFDSSENKYDGTQGIDGWTTNSSRFHIVVVFYLRHLLENARGGAQPTHLVALKLCKDEKEKNYWLHSWPISNSIWIRKQELDTSKGKFIALCSFSHMPSSLHSVCCFKNKYRCSGGEERNHTVYITSAWADDIKQRLKAFHELL